MRRILFAIVGLMLPLWAMGQPGTGQNGDVLRNEVLDSGVASVQLIPAGRVLAPPVVTLSGSESLLLSFDYIRPNPPQLAYRILHCDRSWRPDRLLPSDYMRGFELNYIASPSPSVATTVPFSHYELRLPNPEVELLVSGNYVVQVVDASTPDRIIIQWRFALSEDLLPIAMALATVPGERRASHQRVELSFNPQGIGGGVDPWNLQVYLMQNWDVDCMETLPAPKLQGDGRLLYGDQTQPIFPGGNRWRVLDIQDLNTPGVGVSRIAHDVDGYMVEVEPDRPLIRFDDRPNLHGYCAPGYAARWGGLLPNARFNSQAESADYAWVYFSFRLQAYVAGRVDLYLASGAAQGDRIPMRYNAAREQYEVSLRLKQGVYSYRYVQVSGMLQGCEAVCPLEGCFSETTNEYAALVYYCAPADRYDRLVGFLRKDLQGFKAY